MQVSTLLIFPVLFSVVSAICSLDDLRCCLTEFVNFVTPRGITLSEQRLSAVCTESAKEHMPLHCPVVHAYTWNNPEKLQTELREETVGCMEVFLDQCGKNATDENELIELVNKTTSFIDNVCPPTSDFIRKLKSKEACILGSSRSFQTCYNRTLLPDSGKNGESDALKEDCCQYKELRNCAVQTVEDECGADASQLIHEQVVNINGAVVEWACTDIFKECGNSAVMLASSAFFVLYKIILLKILL